MSGVNRPEGFKERLDAYERRIKALEQQVAALKAALNRQQKQIDDLTV